MIKGKQMNTDQRIAIAEWMGWVVRDGDCYNPNDPGDWAEMPHFPLPDPANSADDCEALIRALNDAGWWVEVSWQHTSDDGLAAGAWVHIWNSDSEVHHRNDVDVGRWKECLCNLALEIIEANDEEGRANNEKGQTDE